MALNPLFWLHQRLANSRRNLIVVPAAFSALVIGLASLTHYVSEGADFGEVASTWLIIVTAAQALFLMLVGPSAIRRAVLTDFQTGMIDSHRLSPMSSFKIVAGYLSGPPTLAVVLYVNALLFGTYFANQYAISFSTGGMVASVIGGWLFLQLCLLLVTFLVATIVLLAALATAGKTNMIAPLVVIGVFGGWAAVSFIPGIALLTGILSGGVLITAIRKGQFAGDFAVVVLALLVQFALGATFVRAACRKVRSPEKSLFSIPLSLVLLGIWGLTLVGGVARVPQNQWLFSEFSELGNIGFAQLICSTVAFLAVALFALVAAATETFHLDRAAALGAVRSPARRRSLILMPALLGVLTLLTMSVMIRWLPPDDRLVMLEAFRRPGIVAALLAALILSCWLDYCLVYIAAAKGKRVLLVLVASAALLKTLPFAADALIESILWATVQEHWEGKGFLTGLSPIGTLILCRTGGAPLWIGVAVQAVVAALATWRARRVRSTLATDVQGAFMPAPAISLATTVEETP